MKPRFFTHTNPVCGNQANFLIGATSPPPPKDPSLKAWEQLWSKQISQYRFQICCIPFFAYNLSLGDEVETDLDFMVTRVIKLSGHFTFRVWFSPDTPKEHLLDSISEMNCLMEAYSSNLVSIDAENARIAQRVANILAEAQKKGEIVYETGKI